MTDSHTNSQILKQANPADGEQRALELVEQAELGGRRLSGWQGGLAGGIALAWSLFQLYAAFVGNVSSNVLTASHLAFAFALTYLLFPFHGRGRRKPQTRVPWFDWGLGVLATGSVLYLLYQYNTIVNVQGGVVSALDVWVGSVTVLLLLVAAWRTIGPAMPIIAVLFILYALTGPKGLIPGDLGRTLQLHAGQSWSQVVGQLYVTNDGIFGTPITVSATIVFLFVLFGAVFDRLGAGDWFMYVAQSILGSFRGGPAKASVVSSALNGLVSGSAVSNVVTGGNITIGTMKRVGYSAEKAGAIEVASSSNGQLMPPVMGAAAFLLAQNLNIPYQSLILAAAIPAFLCYAALLVAVHIEALKLGLRGLSRSELPPLGKAFMSGWYYILPLGYLIWALSFQGITPERAALNTIFAMLIMMFGQEAWRALRDGRGLARGLRDAFFFNVQSLGNAARSMVTIAIATACAGIIVGIVTITGIGFGLADIVQTVAGSFTGLFAALGGLLPFVSPEDFAATGTLIVVLVMAQLISLLLGMGLPTTANYIMMAALVAPIIARVAGLEPTNPAQMLPVHMFVFYFGIMADSTPPVALAAFAAAAISGGDPLKTGVQGFIYELRTALVAYMMFFNPQLLLISGGKLGNVGVWEAAYLVLFTFIGLVAFSAATLGFLHRRTNVLQRLLLLVASLVLVAPTSLTVNLICCAVIALVYLWQRLGSRTPLRPEVAAA